MWKVKGKKNENFHQASAQYPVFSPLRKCQNFEVSPKITNYGFPLREISWGLQKKHSLGLNTHTSCTVADMVLGLFLNCVTCKTHAWKQYSQLWLKIPQVLKTPLFRSVYKPLMSFCSQEYNLTQHNSSLLCLQYTQTSWYPAEIQSVLLIPSAFPGMDHILLKRPRESKGQEDNLLLTAKHWWSPGVKSEAPPCESIHTGTVPAQPISFHSGFPHWVWNINHKQAWIQFLKKIKQKKKVLQRQCRKPHSPLQIKQICVMEKSSHPNPLLPGHTISKDNLNGNHSYNHKHRSIENWK